MTYPQGFIATKFSLSLVYFRVFAKKIKQFHKKQQHLVIIL